VIRQSEFPQSWSISTFYPKVFSGVCGYLSPAGCSQISLPIVPIALCIMTNNLRHPRACLPGDFPSFVSLNGWPLTKGPVAFHSTFTYFHIFFLTPRLSSTHYLNKDSTRSLPKYRNDRPRARQGGHFQSITVGMFAGPPC